MRSGRYKKNYIAKEELPALAQKVHPQLLAYQKQYDQKQISAPEFAAQYVLTWLKEIKPKNWKGGPHNSLTIESFTRLTSKKETIEKESSQNEPSQTEQGQKLLPPGLEIFKNHSLRSVPLSVNTSLVQWERGHYPLKLFDRTLSTHELLNLQIKGFRCVSVITDLAQIQSYIMNERDPLSFAIHDLIHADHFFEDPTQRLMQINFSKMCLELMNTDIFQKLLTQDKKFEKDFEYVCSDMNAHIKHLEQTLKAVTTFSCERTKTDTESVLNHLRAFGLKYLESSGTDSPAMMAAQSSAEPWAQENPWPV